MGFTSSSHIKSTRFTKLVATLPGRLDWVVVGGLNPSRCVYFHVGDGVRFQRDAKGGNEFDRNPLAASARHGTGIKWIEPGRR